MEPIEEQKIKSLLIKGFIPEEISKIIRNSDIEKIKEIKIPEELPQKSIELYSELQKDLSKLVLKEMSKDFPENNIIFNSIKLQAELQEKKLSLSMDRGGSNSKIKKDYIYERDEEIVKLIKGGAPEQEIAKTFNVSVLSVKQALDRKELNLSEELKTLSPSIISETSRLDNKTRMSILNDAFDRKLTRNEVRKIVNDIKNKSR